MADIKVAVESYGSLVVEHCPRDPVEGKRVEPVFSDKNGDNRFI